MTLMEQLRGHHDTQQGTPATTSRWAGEKEPGDSARAHPNVGNAERAISVAAGSIAVIEGLNRGSLTGLAIAALGGGLIHRGVTGHCKAYQALQIDTAQPAEQSQQKLQEQIDQRGIHVEQAFLINRSADDLYNYWRNFENLPQIMTYLKSVTVQENKSHWIATAPKIAGGKIEWDAEITEDKPGEKIAWRSTPGSSVDTIGEIRFSKAMADRGTEVHVTMDYIPPAGKLGHWLATVFGDSPRRQMHEDLRSFKRMMETGDIPTVKGQPRGTCTGEGARQGE